MWIERTLDAELRRLADSFPAVVLTGPRQVGKNFLQEKCFPDYRYLGMYGREAVGAAYVACLTDLPFDLADGITAVNGWRTWPLP